MSDAVVVGGGLSGAAAACEIARAGREVTLVEREEGPHHKVCGEFLSFEALDHLRDLGVEPARLGAVPIDTVGVAGRGRLTRCRLPFPASSLSRFRLDEALLARAERLGARIVRGSSVKSMTFDEGTWSVRLADGGSIEPGAVFLATGKHDLKERRRPQGVQNDLIGLKMHVRLDPGQRHELAGQVELLLFDGGYGGLEPIESGLANLCLLVRKSRFAKAGGRWDNLLADLQRECPHLERRLHQAEPLEQRPLAIAAIPYGFVRRTTPDCFHLGDQAAVIPSFAGDGMSIALHSGRLAAAVYLGGGSAAEFQKRLAADVSAQVRRATWLSRLLVHGWAQTLGLTGLRLFPGALAHIASATRLSPAEVEQAQS
ncbi:MAG TPA: FAD-dependent oxidoreductase [Devosia sp.]|jgi:flavin-dependent dehydrogenase|nr:FAD-dependent oxidoreductase [Devosia sp.]